MIIEYVNFFDDPDVTVSASSEDYAMPASNLRLWNPRIPWQSNALIEDQYLEIDRGADVAFDDFAVGLMCHNFTPAIELTFKAIVDGGSWASPDFSSAITLDLNPRTNDTELYNKAFNLFVGSGGTYRKARIYMDDPTNTVAGNLRVGRAIIGSAMQLTRPFSKQWQERLVDPSIKTELDAGEIQSHLRKLKTVLALSFRFQNKVAIDWLDLEMLRHAVKTFGPDRYFFISLLEEVETRHPVAKSELSFYVRFLRMLEQTEINEPIMEAVCEFEEFI